MDNSNIPIDEVSLPGVGDNEQQTILEVLNRRIAGSEDENGTGNEPTKEERTSGDTLNAIKITSTLDGELQASKSDTDSDILVSSISSSKAQTECNEPQRSQLIEDEEHVFDIESHLIETLNNYSVSEDSESWGVDIKELPPAEGESIHRTSKIETDDLGTVFEVEPATPKILKPIEISIREPQRQSGLAQKTLSEELNKVQDTNEPKERVVLSEQGGDQYEQGETVVLTQQSEVQEDICKSKEPVILSELSESDQHDWSSEPFETLVQKSESQTTQDTTQTSAVVEPELEVGSNVNDSTAEAGSKKSLASDLQKESDAYKFGTDTETSYLKPEIETAEADNTESERKTSTADDPITNKLNSLSVEGVDCLDSADEPDPESLRKEFSLTEPSTDCLDSAEPIETKNPISQSIQEQSHCLVFESEAERTTDVTNIDSNEPKVEQVQEKAVESEPENLNKESPLTVAANSLNPSLVKTLQSEVEILNEKEKTDDRAQSIDRTQQEDKSTAKQPQSEASINISLNDDTKTDLLSKDSTSKSEDSPSLTQEIDQQLSELSTHLAGRSNVDLNGNISKLEEQNLSEESTEIRLDINGLPLPTTAHEEEQRKLFLDSLPQISLETDSNKVAAFAKREYYQSLKQYLITHSDKPPVPPETYRWEDLKRAKQRGGYPWTHLYKRPLGQDEEPEIVLLLRKSQELHFASESPKSFKKVRIDDQVSIKETERYIQELSDVEDNPATEDVGEEEQEDARSECISCVSDSVLTVEKRASKLGKLRGILKKRNPKKESDARSLPDTSTAPSTSSTNFEENTTERPSRSRIEPHNKAKCFPIMKKLRSMADRQKKNFKNIKKISLKKDEKIDLEEEQKIIKLKTSPKAERSEIPHFIEKQDSDDVLEIVELDESPSRKRKDQLDLQEQSSAGETSTVLVPDEIIEIPETKDESSSDRQQTPEPTVSEILEEELKSSPVFAAPPKKTARLHREHVYEDIESSKGEVVSEEIKDIIEVASVEALKQSLAKQDSSTLSDVEAKKIVIPLDRMGSSEEEIERSKLAPLSSIDSASSEDERKAPHLSPVAEESDGVTSDKEDGGKPQCMPEGTKATTEHIPWNDIELKPALKKESSPSPSDKKVTFSHVEDEAEPHREDIELPEGLSGVGPKRWSNLR